MRISRRIPSLSDIKDRIVANLSRFQFSQEPVLLIFAAVTGILGEIRQALTDKEVKNLLDVLVVKDILVPTKLSVTQNEDLSFALKLMIDAGVPSVPVVREGNQLMGMLFLNDATQAYDKKLLMSEVSTESDKR
ncbi:MAG TPA: CBS domain-containing protein [Candidatus Kryptonia bacterium]